MKKKKLFIRVITIAICLIFVLGLVIPLIIYVVNPHDGVTGAEITLIGPSAVYGRDAEGGVHCVLLTGSDAV